MYRVELFDLSKGKFRDACMVSDAQTIPFDYIAPESFQLVCPKIKADILDAVRISSDDKKIFEGYISAVEHDDRKTVLSISPFLKLLDVASVQNASTELFDKQIYKQLYYDFMQRIPSLYPLPLVYKSGYGAWGDTKALYNTKLESDMKCIISAAEVYGKFMHFEITDDLKIGFSFLSVLEKIKIEADLGNVISKEINIDSDTGFNIAMIWYPINDINYHHRNAYILPDGSISYDIKDNTKVVNPRVTAKTVEKDFETNEEAENELLAMLKPENKNNEIILRVRKTDKIIDAVNMKIGQPADIISEGITYDSILTGKNYSGDIIELIFGGVRHELTKKLQRR